MDIPQGLEIGVVECFVHRKATRRMEHQEPLQEIDGVLRRARKDFRVGHLVCVRMPVAESNDGGERLPQSRQDLDTDDQAGERSNNRGKNVPPHDVRMYTSIHDKRSPPKIPPETLRRSVTSM